MKNSALTKAAITVVRSLEAAERACADYAAAGYAHARENELIGFNRQKVDRELKNIAVTALQTLKLEGFARARSQHVQNQGEYRLTGLPVLGNPQ
jgi:hypothetical protein